MKIKPLAASLLAVLLVVPVTLLANVKSVRFIDQNGKPLVNLVVEVDANLDSPQKKHLGLPKGKQKVSHIMDQVDKQFKPEILLIRKGDNVAFPNSDNIRHHVYSFSQAKPFELRLYSGRPTTPIVFPQHGVVTLGCNIHDSMVGFIYVADSQNAYVTDGNGTVQLENVEQITKLTTWHPQQKQTPELPQTMDMSLLNDTGVIQYTISIIAPPARDTFGAKFKDAQ